MITILCTHALSIFSFKLSKSKLQFKITGYPETVKQIKIIEAGLGVVV